MKSNQSEASEDHGRGRDAEKPSEISGRGWKDVLKRTKKEIAGDNMTVIAAGVAFYLLIGLVPALIALISIYGLVADPQQIQQQFAALSGTLPTAVTDLITQQMQRIASNSVAAGWGAAISILVALWGASSAMKALIKALNIAYDEEETRGFFKLTAITLVLTLSAIVLGIVAVLSIVALPAILRFVGLGEPELMANLIRWPLLAVLAITGLAILYRFAPNRSKPEWRWVTWGSASAMVIWVIGSAAFSFYVSNFGKYNETYGSLAAIVIMMLWLFLSAFAVLFGAELNAEMERQTARDTTKEPEKPMGQRGAHAADNLGESYA